MSLFSNRKKLAAAEEKISRLKAAAQKAKDQRDRLKVQLSKARIDNLTASDAYFSLSEEDIKLIESLKCPSEPSAEPDLVVDYVGCKVSPLHFPSIKEKLGTTLTVPVPSDGILHHALEYVGLGLAIAMAKKNRPGNESFEMAELGAGNGIWAARTALCALNAGFKKISLTCVEADRAKFPTIKENFQLNGLWERSDVKIREVNTPVTSDGRNVFFPVDETSADYGVAVSDEEEGSDYRGHGMKMEERSSISLSELLGESTVYDFLNIDIQGAESDLVTNAASVLAEKVRVMVIGTHSRLIEGQLLEALYQHGFHLYSEKPCVFRHEGESKNLCGRILQDGEQIWVNPKLGAS